MGNKTIWIWTQTATNLEHTSPILARECVSECRDRCILPPLTSAKSVWEIKRKIYINPFIWRLFPSEGITGDLRLWAKLYASDKKCSGKAHYRIFVNTIRKKAEKSKQKGKEDLSWNTNKWEKLLCSNSLNQEAEPVSFPLAVVLTYILVGSHTRFWISCFHDSTIEFQFADQNSCYKMLRWNIVCVHTLVERRETQPKDATRPEKRTTWTRGDWRETEQRSSQSVTGRFLQSSCTKWPAQSRTTLPSPLLNTWTTSTTDFWQLRHKPSAIDAQAAFPTKEWRYQPDSKECSQPCHPVVPIAWFIASPFWNMNNIRKWKTNLHNRTATCIIQSPRLRAVGPLQCDLHKPSLVPLSARCTPQTTYFGHWYICFDMTSRVYLLQLGFVWTLLRLVDVASIWQLLIVSARKSLISFGGRKMWWTSKCNSDSMAGCELQYN